MSSLAESRTLADVLRSNATARPHKVAFEAPAGRSVTFLAFNERVNQLNHAVAALGLKKGARVAILSRNCTEYVEVYGLSKSGLIVVPLNWRLSAPELTKLLLHSVPELLIVDEEHCALIDGLRESLHCIEHFVRFGAASVGWKSYEALIAAEQTAEPVGCAHASDVLCLIYTSGTTGDPKGVAITHDAALGNCRAAAQMLGLNDSDSTMAVMPLFHVGGMWYHLFPSFATGCTTLILATFAPVDVYKALETHRITNVHLVPTMIGELLAHPAALSTDLSCLRLIFYAASSMPVDILRRALRTFASCGFVQSYGSTEAGVVTALNPDDHHRASQPSGERLLLSCGRPLAEREVRIVDDLGCVLVGNEIGEIEVRSPDVMQGYWLDDQGTRASFGDGWLKTGDLGYVDAEGYLYIVDRKKDMIVTGGENVFPTEVEGYLYRDHNVLEAAVFGIPDSRWVERVVAAVVLRPGSRISAEELINGLRGHMATYKCPKSIFFVSALPKSAAGKILRKELRSRYGRSMC
jgi:acyl-CoA synthetase (AMP-forming)/AMP-acid ligase II